MAERLALQRAAEVLDTATKYAFHSKRAALAVADLRLAGGAPGHGDAATPLPELLHVFDAVDLLCRAEAEVLTSEQTSASARLPAVPLEAGVAPHWLAINGVQPTTVENALPRRTAVPIRAATGAGSAAVLGGLSTASALGTASGSQLGEEAGRVIASLPLKHSMPEELQLYFDAVRQALQSNTTGHGALGGRAVAASLATDPGLQPMLPYLVPLLVDEMGKNLGDAKQLHIILSAMRGLLSNTDLHLLPYIHHLLPAVLTCLLARNIGTAEEHWTIRDDQHKDALAAALARVQQALASALSADGPPTQYGSLVGLTALGVPVLLSTLVPTLERYAYLFQDGELTITDLHVRAAVLVAVGRCMSWNGGAYVPLVLQSVPDASFRAALQAVAPVSIVHL